MVLLLRHSWIQLLRFLLDSLILLLVFLLVLLDCFFQYYWWGKHELCLVSLQLELFKALEKTRLLVGDRKKSQYSRCGRTDKGVSAFGQVSQTRPFFCFLIKLPFVVFICIKWFDSVIYQVIALFLRSNLKETNENNKLLHEFGQQQDGETSHLEIKYPVEYRTSFICFYCSLSWSLNCLLLSKFIIVHSGFV